MTRKHRDDQPPVRPKIVATIGPAARASDVVRRLISAGVNVFRRNFSHGTHAFRRVTKGGGR